MNDLQCYPEIEQYILVNNYLGTETHVTLKQVKEMFGEEKTSRILTNRDDYWTLIKE